MLTTRLRADTVLAYSHIHCIIVYNARRVRKYTNIQVTPELLAPNLLFIVGNDGKHGM